MLEGQRAERTRPKAKAKGRHQREIRSKLVIAGRQDTVHRNVNDRSVETLSDTDRKESVRNDLEQAQPET
jgi:hypothetical protein